MSEQQKRLERIRHLLHLVQMQIIACGGCSGAAQRHMDTAMVLIDREMGIKPRHPSPCVNGDDGCRTDEDGA